MRRASDGRALARAIRAALAEPATLERQRRLAELYRDAIVAYQEQVVGGRAPRALRELAAAGMRFLGGEPAPCALSLKDYDHARHGPYLGVSDEGSAAAIIREAGLRSPKARALGGGPPIAVGIGHDAERLAAVGEVPVGPEEYIRIRLECCGRILTSTNVGTRVNLRFYRRFPVVEVGAGTVREAVSAAAAEVAKVLEPFRSAPGGARPMTVMIRFAPDPPREDAERVAILAQLAATIARPARHRLGYQVRIGWGVKGQRAAARAIETAQRAGIRVVALDGVVRKQADQSLSQPGLLNYLAPGHLGPLLRQAKAAKVSLRPVNPVDPDTVARTVWNALHTARQMGLELGKYGLFPLTLEENEAVIEQVQRWFSDWSAAPVFFVDQGLLSETEVHTHGDVVRGLKLWLRMVARHGVRVVLIDTVDKASGKRLLREKGDRLGVLGPRQVSDVNDLAARLGVRALWAGGITLPQAYRFGQLGVFGIYVTSAAASARPVPPEYEKDPWLATVKEPTPEGVARAKLLLEAGFLSTRVGDAGTRDAIERGAAALIAALQSGAAAKVLAGAERALAEAAVEGWRLWLDQHRARGSRGERRRARARRR